MLPQDCFHIDAFIFPYLLEFIDSKNNLLRISFKKRENIFQRTLLLVLVCEGKGDLRRASYGVQPQQRPDASDRFEESGYPTLFL